MTAEVRSLIPVKGRKIPSSRIPDPALSYIHWDRWRRQSSGIWCSPLKSAARWFVRWDIF
jgi:hypothetical protein